jgi:RNA polymerase sigma-70 factor, ECF subfamily
VRPQLDAECSQLLARERRRVVSQLARSLGLSHLAVAEDAVQTAAMRALQRWPDDGVPANPAAWLYRVARHAAIDALRRDNGHDPWPDDGDDAWARLPVQAPPTGRFAGELDDDELALLFAACHPLLPPASQVALALRASAGLELTAIAQGLLCSEAALAQRLQRARELLRNQPLQLPAGAELVPRREQVFIALSLMFHAGMTARHDAAAHRHGVALCWEAVRLSRALAAHPVVAHADADALAALLLLHGARLTGRLDAAGDIVLLPGQPRDRWDAGMVRLGFAHLQAAERASRLSRWHVLAGIAAVHASAADYASTDWQSIVRYYDMLLQMDDSAAPRLGHAIALAEAGMAHRAQDLLQRLLPEAPLALRAHTLAALARAHERVGEMALARSRLHEAVDAALNDADARLLARRALSLTA